MNNPLRSLVQRRIEARQLVKMGGVMAGGRALEVGCGRGEGLRIILEIFGADEVVGFDLDPRMVQQAQRRIADRDPRARVMVGDATRVQAPDASFDAVFDFGIIHHVPHWTQAVAEVSRVLKPGGMFYGEEILRGFIDHPLARTLFDHPAENRFDAAEFQTELERNGLTCVVTRALGKSAAWFVARQG